ncbi:ATP-dependent RNA helicase-like protein dbp5 [Bisporella sp. PMI_857]|nr:ATP-dependent RNA helicase-like protein dbp5 [Bisporella sp. PMI_857]
MSAPKSLEERMSQPLNTAAKVDSSWADEVASPTGAAPSAAPLRGDAAAISQVDGATEAQEGSALQDSEFDVELKLADMQMDQNNPLFSTQKFDELGINEHILKGLISLGYQKPSKIQQKALPLLLAEPPRNMIAQSQSGTGKTAAFVITILSKLDYTKPHSPQALILAPSRELARQIEGVFKAIGQFIEGLTIQAAVPGAVERGAKVQAMVIVGTPGTAMDLIKRRQLDPSAVYRMCLDEADNMLDQQGLGEQCMRTKQMLPRLQQILLFSATFPDGVVRYAQQFSPNANEIRLARNNLTVSGIKQMFMDCSNGEDGKFQALVNLYTLLTVGSSIIFVKTRETASGIAAALNAANHKVVAIHGAFDGNERDSILEDFRSGKSKILITTNVLARGIDVQSVTMVINYDIPTMGRDNRPDPETYLHRIGRTGRFGRVGVSISFVFDRHSYQALKSITDHFGIDLQPLNPNDMDANEKTIQQIIKSSRAGTNFKT